jgi:hypothetical protein
MRAYGIASLMPACVIPGRRKSGRMLMRLATPLSTRHNKVSSAVSSLMEILVIMSEENASSRDNQYPPGTGRGGAGLLRARAASTRPKLHRLAPRAAAVQSAHVYRAPTTLSPEHGAWSVV